LFQEFGDRVKYWGCIEWAMHLPH